MTRWTLVALVALSVAACTDEPTVDARAGTTNEVSTTEAPDAVEMIDCVSDFSLAGLSDRAFAFDGTAVEVVDEVDPQLEDTQMAQRGRALFAVNEWFAGGGEDTVLVWMQRDVQPGDRLLVSGQPRWGGEPLDDAIQWECGWTVEHSADDADAWRAATGDGT